MAQLPYRANLSAAQFPLLTELFGPSIIVPQIDQNFDRGVNSPREPERDRGIPQVYYCHNVIPTVTGYQSVSYQQLFGRPDGAGVTYDENHKVITRQGTNALLMFSSNTASTIRARLAGDIAWRTVSTPTNIPAGASVTVATAYGRSYIQVAGVGCFIFDADTNSLVSVAFTGRSAGDMLGISTSNGFIIAYTADAVYWSSSLDPANDTTLDFTPSLTTGAGGGKVAAAKSKLTVVLQSSYGFTIFTENNAIAGVYSGNARYPFNLREITGCGGLKDKTLAAYESNSGETFAYTTFGLQEISTNAAKNIFPEVTDFISGRVFEDFDETTLTFTRQELGGPLKKKLVLVAGRYLVISYGIVSLTHALIIDLTLRRFGKLKLAHVDCFEYEFLSSGVTEIPRDSVALLAADGSVTQVSFTLGQRESTGVLLLGKVQYVRSRFLCLQEVYVESVRSTDVFTAHDFSSLDLKNTSVKQLTLTYQANNVRQFNCDIAAANHSIMFIGKFNLTGVIMKFYVHGGY